MTWEPTKYPFVVRSLRQSSQAGCFGWSTNNVGSPLATYAEARSLADRPMGVGEKERTVVQAINPATWQKNGSWRTCFKRKRGGIIIEQGPI